MSSWNEFCQNVKKTATLAADKIGQTVDIATLQVKLSTAESKLDEAYAVLGQLAYNRTLEQEVEEAQWNRAISAVAERIRICEDLKAQIANAKGTQL
jgi:hypothetical protein